ncbi:hypothetical protein Tco_1411114 [Tanacetum coccineum]
MQILSVARIKAYSRNGYDYLSEIVLRRANFQEHTIAKKDFKNLYPSDFKDLNLLLLQGHLNHLCGSDKWMLSTTQLNLTKPGWDAKGYEFKHDYTITESPRAVFTSLQSQGIQDQAAQSGYEYAILDSKGRARSNEFIATNEMRLKTRRIYRNLECFVGGRVRDINYRLLQRTK